MSLPRQRPGPLARLLVVVLGVLPLGVRAQAPQQSPPAATSEAPTEAKAPATPEAAPPPPEKVDPKLFEQGVGAFFAGDTRAAAPLLFRYVQATPSTDENHAWAQYFLGRALIDLGLKHAGGTYLARVARERSNPEVLPRALEALQTLTGGPHDEVLIDEEIFGAMDLGFLPDGVRDWTHLQQGLVDLRTGSERWARTHFAKITEGSLEASQARFAILVTRLRDAQEKVPDVLVEDFLATAQDERLPRRTRNEAFLAVARLRYERGDFEGALRAYAKVTLPALDPGRATLYLEEAWTRYRLGELRAALGLLTTLDAPSFRDEFQPDKYLLRAFVFRDLCHYLPAKRAARELTRRYGDSLQAITEREDLTTDVRLVRAAASHGATQRAALFLESLELEGEQLGRHAGSFGDRLFSHLAKLYTLARSEAIRVHRAHLEEGVREEADRLLRAAEQVRLMEYEVGLKLYERIKQDARLVPPPEEEALAPGQVAFPFNGEYWNDELRSYRVSIKSRCVEETP